MREEHEELTFSSSWHASDDQGSKEHRDETFFADLVFYCSKRSVGLPAKAGIVPEMFGTTFCEINASNASNYFFLRLLSSI